MKEFLKCLPQSRILTSSDDLEYYGKDVCQQFAANPSAVLLPETVEEVYECVKIAFQHHISLVPSGGRTGYSAGATATNGEVILSLVRLNKILDFNPTERTLKVQAGVPLEVVQNYANERGLQYPVDFTSRGSCLIGGTIATNAGGVRVVKYGLTREWVSGLKVITGDARLLDLDGRLVKNQTGYDLRQLYIGSEGTLGIVVEATLKLTSVPAETELAFCAFQSPEHVLTALDRIRAKGLTVELFEYLDKASHELVLRHHSTSSPFQDRYSGYGLIEVSGPSQLREAFENVLSDLIEGEVVADIVLGENQQQRQNIMDHRELIGEIANQHYIVHKNDISVGISDIPEFLGQFRRMMDEQSIRGEAIVFGHIGDGNLHINLLMPENGNKEEFWKVSEELDQELFALVQKFRGSISAEHGVGLLKKPFLHFSKSEDEIDFMRKIKAQLDPKCILNPGKIFEQEQ